MFGEKMEEKTCRKCGEVKPLSEYHRHPTASKDGHINTCKICRAEYHAKWRKQNPQKYGNTVKAYCARNPEKVRARSAVRQAVKNGTLRKPDTCSRCGSPSPRIEAHHPDYSKPLIIEWLCRFCHEQVHKSILQCENIAP